MITFKGFPEAKHQDFLWLKSHFNTNISVRPPLIASAMDLSLDNHQEPNGIFNASRQQIRRTGSNGHVVDPSQADPSNQSWLLDSQMSSDLQNSLSGLSVGTAATSGAVSEAPKLDTYVSSGNNTPPVDNLNTPLPYSMVPTTHTVQVLPVVSKPTGTDTSAEILDRESRELSRVSTASSESSTTSLPPYEEATRASSTSPKTAPGFHPTQILQIETAGISMIRVPFLPPQAMPVPIRTVSHTGEVGPAIYQSIQASRTSGSCVLIRAESNTPVCTTIYAPGPIRSPQLRHIPTSQEKVVTQKEASKILKAKAPHDAEIIHVRGENPASRTCSVRTSLGHFQWRYGNRSEKRDAGGPVMLLERIREQTLPNGKKKTVRKRIGQLLRNREFRSEGSSRMAAGKGGRLMLDLSEWADRKADSCILEILAVTSCLVMLRKEMNQRRLKQVAVVATVAAIL